MTGQVDDPIFTATLIVVTAGFSILVWCISLFVAKIPFFCKTAHRRRMAFVWANLGLQAAFLYFFTSTLQERASISATVVTMMVTLATLWITKFCPSCGTMTLSLRRCKLCDQCIHGPAPAKQMSHLQIRLMGLSMLAIAMIMIQFGPSNYVTHYPSTVSMLLVGGLYFLVHG